MGSAFNIVSFGFGSAALTGLVLFLLNKFRSGNISDTLSNLFNKKQEEAQQTIQQNYTESAKLEVKVKEADKVSEEKKQEIKKITETATQQINQVLNKTNISDIQKDIDDGYSKL